MKIEVKFEFECDNDRDYDKSYLEEVALYSIRDVEDRLKYRGFKIVQNSLQIKTLEENNLEKVEQMGHNFKVGDYVTSILDVYRVTTPGVKCKIVKFIDENQMEVEIVGQEDQGEWRVRIKNFKLWEEREEFEPITRDNIVEVLEYNGFKEKGEKYYEYNNMMLCISHGLYQFGNNRSFSYNPNITHKDLNKVLDFMKEFIDLKPLPKKEVFDPKQFLLDNGFAKNEEDKIIYKGFYFGVCFKDYKKFTYRGKKYTLTKENIHKLIEAAEILEGLE